MHVTTHEAITLLLYNTPFFFSFSLLHGSIRICLLVRSASYYYLYLFISRIFFVSFCVFCVSCFFFIFSFIFSFIFFVFISFSFLLFFLFHVVCVSMAGTKRCRRRPNTNIQRGKEFILMRGAVCHLPLMKKTPTKH